MPDDLHKTLELALLFLEHMEWECLGGARPDVYYCPNCNGTKPEHDPACRLDRVIKDIRARLAAG